MLQPDRAYNSGLFNVDYRYGFQGQEKDDEIKGKGNSYDYGARFFDPRVGRWLSGDPMEMEYTSLSPYVSMGNNPVYYVDPHGDDILGIGKWLFGSDASPLQPGSRGALAAIGDFFSSSSIPEGIITVGPLCVNCGRVDPNSLLPPPGTESGYKPDVGLINDAFYAGMFSVADMVSPIPLDGLLLGRQREIYDGLLEVRTPIEYAMALTPLGFAKKGGKTAIKKVSKEIIEEGANKASISITKNLKRFIKKIPANSKTSATIKKLDDGYLFEATSPGKVPGSKAIYQKWVNTEGKTIKYLKTSFDPKGNVIHVKPK